MRLLIIAIFAGVMLMSQAKAQGENQPFMLHANKIQVGLQEEQRLKTSVTVPPLAPGIPRLDNKPPGSGSMLDVFEPPQALLKGKTKTNVRLLANYDIELIVDSSLSMRRNDCPSRLSRWNWCGVQARDLGYKLSPYVPRGLTITAFASDFTVYRNATPANIADLFNNPNFHGGTRLAEPLSNRLNEFFARRKNGSKPLLIAVITDGVPHPNVEPMMVVDTLIKASRAMSDPREVTVVFFQIGGRAKFGRTFLDFLDKNLVERGARYDFVKTVPFEHLVQVGLSQALVESIQQFASNQKGASFK